MPDPVSARSVEITPSRRDRSSLAATRMMAVPRVTPLAARPSPIATEDQGGEHVEALRQAAEPCGAVGGQGPDIAGEARIVAERAARRHGAVVLHAVERSARGGKAFLRRSAHGPAPSLQLDRDVLELGGGGEGGEIALEVVVAPERSPPRSPR